MREDFFLGNGAKERRRFDFDRWFGDCAEEPVVVAGLALDDKTGQTYEAFWSLTYFRENLGSIRWPRMHYSGQNISSLA